MILGVALASCGGSTSHDATHGSTGSTAGSSGRAGGSGSPSGGSATGGAAGGVSIGGASSGGATSGDGGSTTIPDGWECARDDDCVVIGDCCGCYSVPVGTGSTCPLACAFDHCTDFASRPTARCSFGRCVLALECQGPVACTTPPPSCGEGSVATVSGECYGPCVAATECPTVLDCSACTGPNQACVFENGATGIAHCVDVPSRCNGSATCACMSALCGGITPCADLPNGIACGGG